MPYCVKCNCEYREGFTVCSDCGTELVEDYPVTENESSVEIEEDLPNATPKNRLSRLPIIALAFGFAPAILFLLAWTIGWIHYVGIIIGYLFFGTWWGIYFQVVGVILGIIALLRRAITKKQIGEIGMIFSIIAILSPIIWLYILYYLDNYTSVEIWL